VWSSSWSWRTWQLRHLEQKTLINTTCNPFKTTEAYVGHAVLMWPASRHRLRGSWHSRGPESSQQVGFPHQHSDDGYVGKTSWHVIFRCLSLKPRSCNLSLNSYREKYNLVKTVNCMLDYTNAETSMGHFAVVFMPVNIFFTVFLETVKLCCAPFSKKCCFIYIYIFGSRCLSSKIWLAT
jgi:hypothetical protein